MVGEELRMIGSIGFSHPKKMGFYSKAVRWFTKSNWSHCFYIAPQYMGELMVIETDLKVQVVPFIKEYQVKAADNFELYLPFKAEEEEIYNACKSAFSKTAGETYGFFSIPWFAVRSILNSLFRIVLKKNYVSSGVICSELVIIFLKDLGGEYEKAFSTLSVEETSPEDIYKIVISRPDLFVKI
jgi:hypothetical protein